MSSKSRKKKLKHAKRKVKVRSAELNIMPFIDIFSMLNTFLLISAAFINLGIIKVQVPFLSNAPQDKTKPTRMLEINVEVDKDNAELVQIYTQPPDDKKTEKFALTVDGMTNLHQRLVTLRSQEKATDKVTVFSEDDVKYRQMVLVLDAIKQLKAGDPRFVAKDEQSGEEHPSEYLYEKIVMGSVIL